GGHRQRGAEPAAVPLRARPDAFRTQAGRNVHAKPAAAPARADAARHPRRPGPQDCGAWIRARRRPRGGRSAAQDRDPLMPVLVLMEEGDPSLKMLTLALE